MALFLRTESLIARACRRSRCPIAADSYPTRNSIRRGYSARNEMAPSQSKWAAGLAATALICLWGGYAMAADGLITIKSAFGPEETMKRLEAEVRPRRMTAFAH